MSFVTTEVPPEVAPSSHSLQLNKTFARGHYPLNVRSKTSTPRLPQRLFTKTIYKDMGLEHIGPFLGAIMQLKPANTGILLGD